MSDSDRHYESSDRYRYKILPGPWSDPGAMVKTLNRFGDRGWELVQVDNDADCQPLRAYMRMLLDEDDPPEEEPRGAHSRPA